MNHGQLVAALEAGSFSDILGTPESEWLDFKQSPYAIVAGTRALTPKGKYELSKDVAALANKNGGVLLLGYKEGLSTTTGATVAATVTPIKVAIIDLSHYKQVLMAQIFPIIHGVTMTWYLTDASAKEGILAIVVPKRQDKHHVIRNYVDENGKQLPGIVIPERVDDHIYNYPAEGVYGLLKSISYIQAEPRTDRALFKPREDLAQTQEIYNSINRIVSDAATVRKQFINMHNWEDQPVLIIQALPISAPGRLANFYDEVRETFVNTKPLRHMGFSLDSLGAGLDTTEGGFVKSGLRDASMRLDPNGTLTLALKASPDFLGWAINKKRKSTEGILINSIVLIEVIFEFARYVNETLTKFGLSNWRYCVEIRNFKKHNVLLYVGGPSSLGVYHPVTASTDSWVQLIHSSRSHPKDTYELLTEVYALFALPPKSIPYTTAGQVTNQNILDLDKNINGF